MEAQKGLLFEYPSTYATKPLFDRSLGRTETPDLPEKQIDAWKACVAGCVFEWWFLAANTTEADRAKVLHDLRRLNVDSTEGDLQKTFNTKSSEFRDMLLYCCARPWSNINVPLDTLRSVWNNLHDPAKCTANGWVRFVRNGKTLYSAGVGYSLGCPFWTLLTEDQQRKLDQALKQVYADFTPCAEISPLRRRFIMRYVHVPVSVLKECGLAVVQQPVLDTTFVNQLSISGAKAGELKLCKLMPSTAAAGGDAQALFPFEHIRHELGKGSTEILRDLESTATASTGRQVDAKQLLATFENSAEVKTPDVPASRRETKAGDGATTGDDLNKWKLVAPNGDWSNDAPTILRTRSMLWKALLELATSADNVGDFVTGLQGLVARTHGLYPDDAQAQFARLKDMHDAAERDHAAAKEQCARLTADLAQAQQECHAVGAAAAAEIGVLRAQLVAAQAELQTATARIAPLETQVATHAATIATLQETERTLRRTIEQLQAQGRETSGLQETAAAANQRLTALQAELDTTQRTLENARAAQSDQERGNQTLQESVRQLEAQLEQQQRDIAERDERIQGLQRLNAQLHAEYSVWHTAAEAARVNLEEAQAARAAALAAVAHISAEREEAVAEIARVRQQLAAAEAAHAQQQSACATLREQVQQLETQLVERQAQQVGQDRVEEYKSQITHLEQFVADLERAYALEKIRTRDAERALAAAQTAAAAAQATVLQLQRQLQQSSNDHDLATDEITARVQTAEAAAQACQQRLEAATAELTEARQSNEALASELQTAIQQMQLLATRLNDAIARNDTLERELRNVCEREQVQRTQSKSTTAARAAFEQQTNGFAEERSFLQEQLRSATATLAGVQQRLSSQMEHTRGLEDQVRKLQAALQEAELSHKEAERRAADLERTAPLPATPRPVTPTEATPTRSSSPHGGEDGVAAEGALRRLHERLAVLEAAKQRLTAQLEQAEAQLQVAQRHKTVHLHAIDELARHLKPFLATHAYSEDLTEALTRLHQHYKELAQTSDGYTPTTKLLQTLLDAHKFGEKRARRALREAFTQLTTAARRRSTTATRELQQSQGLSASTSPAVQAADDDNDLQRRLRGSSPPAFQNTALAVAHLIADARLLGAGEATQRSSLTWTPQAASPTVAARQPRVRSRQPSVTHTSQLQGLLHAAAPALSNMFGDEA